MTLKSWINSEVLYSTNLNSIGNAALSITLQNHIKALIIATQKYGKDLKDLWGEAYVDSDGRNNSIDAALTTATFDTNKYKASANLIYFDIYASSCTTATLTDAGNSVVCVQLGSGVWRVYSSKGSKAEALNRALYLMFGGLGAGATNPNGVSGLTNLRCSESAYRSMFVRSEVGQTWGPGSFSQSITRTQTLNTGTGYITNESMYAEGGTAGGTYHSASPSYSYINTSDNHSFSGAIYMSGSPTRFGICTMNAIYLVPSGSTLTAVNTGTISWNYLYVSGDISISASAPDTGTYPAGLTTVSTIPTGTFSATTSSACVKGLFANWESGCSITHVLSNATESSGTLVDGEIKEFTAFTSEPTKLTTYLIPKGSSPTDGYPAIYGVAIKANNLNSWVDPNVLYAADLDSNYNNETSLSLQNHTKALINAAQTYGRDFKDIWGEAYIDTDGRNNSVDTTPQDASAFITDRYKQSAVIDEASTGTTHDPDAFTNPSNFFDHNNTTYASKSYSNGGGDNGTYQYALGKTFSSKYVAGVRISAQVAVSCTKGAAWCSATATLYLQTYDGGSWSTVATLVTDSQTTMNSVSAVATYNATYNLNATVQGIRISGYGLNSTYSHYGMGMSWTYYTLEYGALAPSTITHNIPTGTYNPTISSACIKSLVADWETGNTITHEITNAGESSGTLIDGEIGNFTAFTTEPTKIITTLTPKITSPTAGYPSIYGITAKVE